MATSTRQRREALTRANDIRLGRALAKREIEGLSREDGVRKVIEYLRAPGYMMRGQRVHEMLIWPRRIGKAQVRKLWFEFAVPPWSEMITIERLTTRQRDRICAVLERRYLS